MFKSIIIIILLSVTTQLKAVEVWAGSGFLPTADNDKGETYSITLKFDKWKFDAAKFSDYGLTPWYEDHVNIWGQRVIESHNVFSVTKRVHRSRDVLIDGLDFYIDFGFSYSDKVSSANSSHVLFRENFGFIYKGWITGYYRHTSNAEIVKPNLGENAVFVDFKILEW